MYQCRRRWASTEITSGPHLLFTRIPAIPGAWGAHDSVKLCRCLLASRGSQTRETLILAASLLFRRAPEEFRCPAQNRQTPVAPVNTYVCTAAAHRWAPVEDGGPPAGRRWISLSRISCERSFFEGRGTHPLWGSSTLCYTVVLHHRVFKLQQCQQKQWSTKLNVWLIYATTTFVISVCTVAWRRMYYTCYVEDTGQKVAKKSVYSEWVNHGVCIVRSVRYTWTRWSERW